MCKDSRIISMKTANGSRMKQVNMPLSLKADKVDDFAKALQDMANESFYDEKKDKIVRKSVAKIDDLVTVYAVSLGIVTVDRKNMTGVAVTNAKCVADAAMKSDKKTAREDLQKGIARLFSGNDWCDDFNWKIENRHVNAMTSIKTEDHSTVNKRNSQTGNTDRTGRIDVKAWCDTVRSFTQCRMKIVKDYE